jgi:NADPH:quinone reductase
MTTATQTMRALQLDGPGDPAHLTEREVDVPSPGEDEFVIRVEASAINRSDVLNVKGLPVTTFPRIPGRDFAGTVTSGPDGMIGRAVFGTGGNIGFTRDGAHAEYIAVPRYAAIDVPAGWSTTDAGASGLGYYTAEAGLSRAAIQRGETALVTGAVGGVGSAAVAIARWRGAKVIGLVKDDDERAILAERFPDVEGIVSSAGNLVQRVGELTEGRGIDVAYDAVGTPVFTDVLAVMGIGGRLANCAAVPNRDLPFDLSAFYRRSLTLIGVNSVKPDCTLPASLLRGLEPGFADGSLPPIAVARTIALAEASEGYAAVWAGEGAGRTVITPGV